jgi:hypothetical protein
MKALSLMTLPLLLITTGCGEITIGPRAERDAYWEKLGTPAKVIDDTKIEVIVKDATGKEVPAKVNPSGMMILDAPTYELYSEAWKKQAAAAREMVDGDVKPEVKK